MLCLGCYKHFLFHIYSISFGNEGASWSVSDVDQYVIIMKLLDSRDYFYCVDQVHGSVLNDGQCAARRETHTNFADESACLTILNANKNHLFEFFYGT
jgi:hypothetical protein